MRALAQEAIHPEAATTVVRLLTADWIRGPEGKCPTRHPSPHPSFHSASPQKPGVWAERG